MTEDPASPRPSRGLIAEAMSFCGSAGRHIQALTALAEVEGREAAALYLRLAIVLGAALVFLLLGYILALLFVAFLAAVVFSISWIWIALTLSVLHLILAFLCALHVRTHLRAPIFEATRSALRQDFEKLKPTP